MYLNTLIYFLILQTITPKESMRFQYVHEQEFDSSCGFSTVSSLLNIYWGFNTNELEIVSKYIKKKGNKNKNDTYKSTLFDLAQIISSYGIANKSFKMNYKQLEDTVQKYSPVLVHYKNPDKHFALVLSISDSVVITADPARGVELLTKEEFKYRWSGVALLTASKNRKINKGKINRVIKQKKRRKKLLEKWSW